MNSYIGLTRLVTLGSLLLGASMPLAAQVVAQPNVTQASVTSVGDLTAVLGGFEVQRSVLRNCRIRYSETVGPITEAFRTVNEAPSNELNYTVNRPLLDQLKKAVMMPIMKNIIIYKNDLHVNGSSFIHRVVTEDKKIDYNLASDSRIFFAVDHNHKAATLNSVPSHAGINYATLLSAARYNSRATLFPDSLPLSRWISDVLALGKGSVSILSSTAGMGKRLRISEPIQGGSLLRVTDLEFDLTGNLQSLACSIDDPSIPESIEFYRMTCSDFQQGADGVPRLPRKVIVRELIAQPLTRDQLNLRPTPESGAFWTMMFKRLDRTIVVSELEVGGAAAQVLQEFSIPKNYSLRDFLTKETNVLKDDHKPFAASK